MFRLLVTAVLIWLLITFTAEVLVWVNALLALVRDHITITIA